MANIEPVNIVNRKEIYPACCSHLFTASENCECCLKGCYHCKECKIDRTNAKEKGEAS